MSYLQDIQFREQGVGLLFYVPGRVIPEEAVQREPSDVSSPTGSPSWRKNLVLSRYYGTLEEAIDGEYDRLLSTPDAGWQLIHSTGE